MVALTSFVTLAGCADDAVSSPGALPSVATPERLASSPKDFPLVSWMKATVQPAMANGNVESLASDFERLARFAPDGYDDWAPLAARGAAAARSGDLEACRVVCKLCHDRYRACYRAEHRARPLEVK